jgi:geranylgeranyl diphosphate synthase type I
MTPPLAALSAVAAPSPAPAAPPSEDPRLDAVEGLMRQLAAGDRLDRAGLMVQEHLSTGGKRLRARLALLAADALGAHHDAVPWAAAVELLHNATLVHDDIQDGDRVRRGQPTTWARHGVAQAINAGDLLLMLPTLALDEGELPDALRWALSRCLSAQAAATVRGQTDELDLLPAGRLDAGAYLRAVEGKTGGLFGLPVEGAALIAGCPRPAAAALAAPFAALGVLFQIQDDILDLYGDKGREAPGADLREGKVSVLVVEHLARVPADRARLLALLHAPREATPDAEVQWAIRAFRASGALAAALERVQALADSISEDPALRAHPGLARVAGALLDRVLAPIRHLLAAGAA